MKKTSIFISSTCYDLRATREYLRNEIIACGHEPILSEFLSFPIDPGITSIENCQKMVRDRADFLLLIVGGRLGSVDPVSQRSIVNLEYREARAKGIDCYIYIDRGVWDLLALYEKNKKADFTPAVDNPAIFEFINDIRRDSRWVFQFSRTEEIIDSIKLQLSVRLHEIAQLVRGTPTGEIALFQNEPIKARRLVLEKPPAWEYELAFVLLVDRLTDMNAKFNDLETGVVIGRKRFVGYQDVIDVARERFTNYGHIATAFEKVFQELTTAFGPPGVAGKSIEIKRACDHVHNLLNQFYEEEATIRCIVPPRPFETMFLKMQGWSRDVLNQISEIPQKMRALLDGGLGPGTHTIALKLESPSSLPEVSAEISRLIQDPEVMEGMRSRSR